jgi:hypothetical protein
VNVTSTLLIVLSLKPPRPIWVLGDLFSARLDRALLLRVDHDPIRYRHALSKRCHAELSHRAVTSSVRHLAETDGCSCVWCQVAVCWGKDAYLGSVAYCTRPSGAHDTLPKSVPGRMCQDRMWEKANSFDRGNSDWVLPSAQARHRVLGEFVLHGTRRALSWHRHALGYLGVLVHWPLATVSGIGISKCSPGSWEMVLT